MAAPNIRDIGGSGIRITRCAGCGTIPKFSEDKFFEEQFEHREPEDGIYHFDTSGFTCNCDDSVPEDLRQDFYLTAWEESDQEEGEI